ncbi:hypothetical protein BTJ40_12005 [Microbulbifer sp. A4B17]|uniref:sensor histidine kinase n=1 Tax=Microbulbifer sp. A4B17 TaxID=359370 RepID=UPI000D52EAFD|nr:histidine kinase [Microbulbifer sp. A4B17]AWF81486.1 hypothetical protein BTJ40_12005 [Microbulbifer sp. A4B17]
MTKIKRKPPWSGNRRLIQVWIFLVVWPLLNILIISTVLYSLKLLTTYTLLLAIIKIWGTFLTGYLLFSLIEKILKLKLKITIGQHYWWLFRLTVIIFIFIGTAPIVEITPQPNAPKIKFLPIIIILLESFVYLSVMYIFKQQEDYYQSYLHTQKSELQVLKMQSNPHFLFNTLNLIATETSRNPLKATELIYNLSDLLRETVRLTKRQWVTIEEELQLVELYLILQQKRFEDRFTFDIDCSPSLNKKLIPSLLLLPVTENAIKHGLAPQAQKGHVSINVELNNGNMEIAVHDTGAPFDDSNIKFGEGLRILAETLRLLFNSGHSMKLSSTSEGASLEICFPEHNSCVDMAITEDRNETKNCRYH